ncbi:MAG: 4-(cytidine 5'-diphospho)-2-C-methyl-D-erythritol kinase [Bacteroidetes bacterium]|nr:4-(cytidine 5'-diphospho)-2-C-methyl-D-erythritol kinase [Bacteroidota bacterium]
MIQFPNCKINLGLHITAKRADGYHEIESVLYPLPLYDALEIVEAKETRFASYGIDVPGESHTNIVLKAYHLLKQDFPNIPSLDICLLKKIPIGAGLGGGSSDGTTMLKLLNAFCNLQLSNDQLVHYASILGSDCPFFVNNIPAIAKGRGEFLEPVALDLSAYKFVIVKPSIHISTAHAFSLITPNPAPKALNTILSQPIESWKTALTNDFEKPIFNLYPPIQKIKSTLYEAGALYSSMSGSGSAVYGIFKNPMDEPFIRSQFPNEEMHFC